LDKNIYNKLSDNEILILAAGGDSAASDFIILKYSNLVKIKASRYYLVGADRNDVIQEGMIGLFKAIRDFNPQHDSGASFKSFAEICIVRQINSAVKMANRQKHMPLNDSVSLDKPDFDESGTSLHEIIPGDEISNPEQIYINRERFSTIEKYIYDRLSRFESEVVGLYLQGDSYELIAKKVSKSPKAIDNAIQRIRKKLEGKVEKE
jgi:RNA polymerase sporulation-specific sigma factor